MTDEDFQWDGIMAQSVDIVRNKIRVHCMLYVRAHLLPHPIQGKLTKSLDFPVSAGHFIGSLIELDF